MVAARGTPRPLRGREGVSEPLLSGAADTDAIATDDLPYVRDLGLVGLGKPVAIANPIYREVIPRALTWTTQEMGIHDDPAWYIADDWVLEVDKLLAAFQEFFREHSEHWVERFQYKEAGPQLLLQAFLQRVVNSGGRIERGRMRTDLLLVWPVGSRVQEGGHRVQGAARGLRADAARRTDADARLHGPLRGGGRGTWCSSTAARTHRGTTRCIAARKPKGGCR